MPRLHLAGTVSLCISLVGALINFAFAVQLLSAWRSLKWEPESEWEGSENSWRGDGVKLVWGLLSAYFAAAATVCVIGFVGIIKSIPSFVRFYRDYSIADFAFSTFFTLVGAYAAFRTSVRAVVCEELSRQPDLMRGMAEMGLNLENCELWFERAVMAFMVFMVVLTVVRLHFLIALANYYCHLSRHQGASLPMHILLRSQSADDSSSSSQHQHIYLLPRLSAFHAAATPKTTDDNDILIYAPIPLSSMSPQQAQNLRTSATEAWISRAEPNSTSTQSGRSYRHGHRRHGSSTGRISLPVSADEGLLPPYEESISSRPSSVKV